MRIDVLPEEWTALPEVAPPDVKTAGRLHGRRPSVRDLTILIHPEALRQVDRHAGSDLAAEVGGLLLGRAFQAAGRAYVEIAAALPAHSLEHGPVHFTFTADAWAQAHREREALYPDLAIVGWFHTHPDLGIFYSADDETVHMTAFTMPWQVGLVVDPLRREAHFFGWQDHAGGVLGPLKGFYELPANQAAPPAVDWQIAHGTGLAYLWREGFSVLSYGGRGEAAGESTVFAPERPRSTGAPAALITGLTLIGAALLLLLTLIPWQWRIDELETVAASLIEEQRQARHLAGEISCPSPAYVIWQPDPGAALPLGETHVIFGTAGDDAAARYRLEVRSLDDPAAAWQTVDGWSRPVTVGELGSWPTEGLSPGRYELRLIGFLPGNAPLFDTACRIPVQLTADS